MIIEHPLLPYTLEYNENNGSVIRRRGSIAEQGNPTDALVAILLMELQSGTIGSTSGDNSALHDEIENLKTQLMHLSSRVGSIDQVLSAANEKVDSLLQSVEASTATPEEVPSGETEPS